MSIKIAIQDDNQRNGKGHVCIVIYDGRTILGVPARGITREEAERMLDVVRYSFEYGVKAAEEAAHNAIRRYGVTVTP
jgi:hypothetical protein